MASNAASDEWADAEDAPSSDVSLAKGSAAVPSLVGMSKEEKDKEMVRRRDERKAVSVTVGSLNLSDMAADNGDIQRITAMKEQKKGKT